MNFITFSRKMGTRGTEIAQLVAREMQYAYYDTEDIEKKAREMGCFDDIKEVIDKAPPRLQRFFSYRPEISLDRLYTVIFELARQGSAVILGRGSNILFRSLPYALHIRVTASPEKRILNLMERGYKKKAARMVMEKSDQERETYVRFAFHRDWNDPDLYDIVFNMDKLSVPTAVEMIVCAARAKELQGRRDETMNSLEMLELAVKVGTALAEAGFPSFYIATFVYAPGQVRLTGVVQVPWEKKEAERVAGKVAGVEHVENSIEVAGQ